MPFFQKAQACRLRQQAIDAGRRAERDFTLREAALCVDAIAASRRVPSPRRWAWFV